ncbi:MAG TPA: universal stress protein [Methylophilaceae bacterium]|jgi:nucleotide-binding universal stress UspA family protein
MGNAEQNHPARRVLLATDLSARCDRAFDRAVQLAQQWQAQLIAVNVAENLQSPDMVLNWAYGDEEENLRILRQQLREDAADAEVPVDVRIVKGEPADSIIGIAEQDGCELIVTGMARSEPFGRFIVGTTVEKLVRQSRQPILVVRKRPHGAYRNVVVATDFSQASALALRATLELFPDQPIVLFHVVKQNLVELASEKTLPVVVDDELLAMVEAFYDAAGVSAEQRARIALHVVGGRLESALTQYVRQHGTDLAVIGSRGQNSVLAGLVGSSVSRLLQWLPCDTLITGARQTEERT